MSASQKLAFFAKYGLPVVDKLLIDQMSVEFRVENDLLDLAENCENEDETIHFWNIY